MKNFIKKYSFFTGLLAVSIITVFTLFTSQTFASGEFVTTWKTDAGEGGYLSASNQITISTYSGENYNFNVDWGDSTSDTGLNYKTTHTYTTPGTYTIKISGLFPHFFAGNDAAKLVSVDAWGTNVWSSMAYSFSGANNFVINATDTPNLSAVTDMTAAFQYAFAFNNSIGSWDVSRVNNMNSMFLGASSFNQPLGSWNTINVTDMGSMFRGASSFNQDINSWDVSRVTNLSGMFTGASSFNQPLASWNTSANTSTNSMFYNASSFNQPLNSWNTSSVTNMTSMFGRASTFNQPLNSWDVSRVTNMTGLFNLASSFNQDLSSWNISSVNRMTGMFNDVTLSVANYDALLSSWSTKTLQSNVSLDAGNSKYCNSATQRTNIINTFHWTINDGGNATCDPIISNTSRSSSSGSNSSNSDSSVAGGGAGGATSSASPSAGNNTPSPTNNSTNSEAKKPETASEEKSETTEHSSTSAIVLTQTLKPMSVHSEVKTLQEYLNNHGFIVSAKGPGSKGYETTKFGSATKKALMKFQKANKLTADGILGSKTIKAIKDSSVSL